MKNEKGQVATLLTLGLVLVGGLVTLGISVLTNGNKIAMNSRAASCSTIQCSTLLSGSSGSVCYQSPDYYSGTCGSTGCGGSKYTNGWHGRCVAGPAPTLTPTPKPGGGGASSDCNQPWVNTADAREACAPNGYTQVGCPAGKFKCTTSSSVSPSPKPGTSTCAVGTSVSGGYYQCGPNCGKTDSGACPSGTHNSKDASCKPCLGTTSITPGQAGGYTTGLACCFAYNAGSKSTRYGCGDTVRYVRLYASWEARNTNGMTTPCTGAAPPNGYGDAYGADNWFECPNNTVDHCENSPGSAETEYLPTSTPTPKTSGGAAGNACEAKNSSNDGYKYSCQAAGQICPSMSSTADSCGDSSLKCCKDKSTVTPVACATAPSTCKTGDTTKQFWPSADGTNFYTDSKCSSINLIGAFTEANRTAYCAAPAAGAANCSTTVSPCKTGDTTKKYYTSIDGANFYTDSKCNNLIDIFSVDNLKNYCAGQGNLGMPQNAIASTNMCTVATTTLTVGGQTISVERNNDPTTQQPCNHVLVAQPGNVMVYRECPNWLSGTTCTYSCFSNGAQVNCGTVFDTTVVVNSVTVFNNDDKPITITVTVGSAASMTASISNATLQPGQYTTGSFQCSSTETGSKSRIVRYTEEGNNTPFVETGTVDCHKNNVINISKK